MGNTLKSLSAGLILLFSGIAFAEDYITQVIGPFGTLNNYDSSISIAADKSQDLLNVDITPGGKSVKKRSGYSTAYSLNYTSSSTHGVYRFYDAYGNENILMANDKQLSSSVNGVSPIVLFSNGSLGATYQCVDYAGYAYCANTAHTTITKTDGATASNLSVISTGTMLAITPDRLVQAGFSGAPNRIDFSASGDFTNWGPLFLTATDPNQITITAPGSHITHIVYAFNRLIWFKDSSFGFVLFDNSSLANWTVRTISPNVGTLDNSSIYWQDILYFRGQDGHFYAFDGANVQRMSRDITNSINQTQTRQLNSFKLEKTDDWNSGVFDSTTWVDTYTVTNALQTLFPDNFNSALPFRDGRAGSYTLWKSTPGSYPLFLSTDTSADNLKLTGTSSGGNQTYFGFYPNVKTPDLSVGTTIHFKVVNLLVDGGNAAFEFGIRDANPSPSATLDRNYIQFRSTTPGFAYLKFYKSEGFGGTTPTTDAFGVYPPFTVDFYIDASKYQVKLNDNIVIDRGGWRTGGTGPVWMNFHYLSSGTCKSGQCGFVIDDFSVVPQTFTFSSAVKNAPNLTTWSNMSADVSNGNGYHAFSIRSSTNSFTQASSTPSWNSIVSGSIPSISTGTYFQLRDVFNSYISTGSLTPVSLTRFSQDWFEGTAADKVYGQYYDYGLWWNVQLGAGSAYNNYVLKYDMINNGWLVYDIPMNGMYVRANNLYFGSSTGGYVYRYGTQDSDNGVAINAYWKSKDYFGDSPFTVKTLAEIGAAATSKRNSSLTLTTTVDGIYISSDTWPLYKPGSGFIKYNNCQPFNMTGDTFNFKFGNNASDQPFEVFAGAVGFRPKPIKDTKQ